MAVLLGLAAALSYGLSDFLGGLVARRVHYAVVSLLGYMSACTAVAVALVLSAPPAPTSDVLLWGAVSGIGGGAGTLALYRGLGRGRMGVVAPLSGLGTAALPVLVGVALGDRPSAVAWAGITLALPAIWLVSTPDAGTPEPDGRAEAPLSASVVDGLLAGVGFAVLLIGLGVAGEDAGLWPVAASEVLGVAVLAAALLGLGRARDLVHLPRLALGGSIVVGLLGASAVVLYFLSTQAGLLSIVVVLTSLYPAVTVLLAAVVLHEGIGRRQAVGLGLAAGSIVLIVVG